VPGIPQKASRGLSSSWDLVWRLSDLAVGEVVDKGEGEEQALCGQTGGSVILPRKTGTRCRPGSGGLGGEETM